MRISRVSKHLNKDACREAAETAHKAFLLKSQKCCPRAARHKDTTGASVTVSVVKGTPDLALSSRAEARRIPWEATDSSNWMSRTKRGFFRRSVGGTKGPSFFRESEAGGPMRATASRMSSRGIPSSANLWGEIPYGSGSSPKKRHSTTRQTARASLSEYGGWQ